MHAFKRKQKESICFHTRFYYCYKSVCSASQKRRRKEIVLCIRFTSCKSRLCVCIWQFLHAVWKTLFFSYSAFNNHRFTYNNRNLWVTWTYARMTAFFCFYSRLPFCGGGGNYYHHNSRDWIEFFFNNQRNNNDAVFAERFSFLNYWNKQERERHDKIKNISASIKTDTDGCVFIVQSSHTVY